MKINFGWVFRLKYTSKSCINISIHNKNDYETSISYNKEYIVIRLISIYLKLVRWLR